MKTELKKFLIYLALRSLKKLGHTEKPLTITVNLSIGSGTFSKGINTFCDEKWRIFDYSQKIWVRRDGEKADSRLSNVCLTQRVDGLEFGFIPTN